jgi:4-aminobutyrate aminotransferase-like enzyme
VVEAVERQQRVLNTNTRYLHPLIAEYARRLAALLPDPLSVVYLTNSGSEANDLALRLARAHTGASDTLVLDHAYHGNLSSLIAISPYKFNRAGGQGRPDGTWVCELPDPYTGRLRLEEAYLSRRYAEDVRRQLLAVEAAGRRPAAFMVETLPGCGGQIVLPEGYLEAAFAHAREAGAVCIADEVQTGFGRVGTHAFAFETHGVVPDIVTFGKPIGNGHPLGAVVTTPALARSFETGMEYFNTFGGNPVSCAAGMAVLDVLREEGLQARARVLGGRMLEGLRELAERHELVGDVRGAGLFLGVELVGDRETREPATAAASAAIEAAKAHGVLLSTDGPAANVIKIKPPLVLSEADVDRTVEVLDTALRG